MEHFFRRVKPFHEGPPALRRKRVYLFIRFIRLNYPFRIEPARFFHGL